MPEVPESLDPKDKNTKPSTDLIRWQTVTYRSVAWSLVGIVALAAVVLTFVFPEWRAAVLNSISGTPQVATNNAGPLVRQARFTNLEGTVRVRKANQVEWSPATVSMGLEEGDTVQTLHDGLARIAFSDGALYVVKPDTLIVLQENQDQNDRSAANVTIQVTSGVVDLSTSRSSGDSRVLFADAEARIHKESRAMVSNNPATNLHQITVSQGGAHLSRGTQQVDLGAYEQATFAGAESKIVRSKIMAPPVLLTPTNFAPVVVTGSQEADVEFTWSPVPSAESYRLRVSHSPIFSTLLLDRHLQSTSLRLPSLKPGDYYWSVSSSRPGLKESEPSDANKFSVIKQDSEGEILLTVDNYVQHGRVIEIIGRTEPGATVLVNNEPVFNIAADGSFKHFTAPLPNIGANEITITAQNSKGKVATLRKTIIIQ